MSERKANYVRAHLYERDKPHLAAIEAGIDLRVQLQNDGAPPDELEYRKETARSVLCSALYGEIRYRLFKARTELAYAKSATEFHDVREMLGRLGNVEKILAELNEELR